MDVVVLTVDQDESRTGLDQVPTALDALRAVPCLRPFERTVGDELQGLLDDPAALPAALEPLLRSGGWNIGIGLGPVETPLPDQARAGRGEAYLAAREAVTAAKSSPWRLRVNGASPATRALESAIWLWAALLARRTERGWQVSDLVDEGLTYDQAATRLGITQSAVSQRAAAAGIAEGRRARELVEFLTGTALEGPR
ncbi:transposase [Nocardioides cynanchi]|uniref:transposase n=1 Tax=Nocardioides cynanchi TaxID=2558918 RepID=UPI0012439C2E|nr:transposase [Nocardioides cynanchi]